MMDSWEAGAQNWTDEMISEFRARRGYDPTPYLPAMAGRVVESAEVSDRFCGTSAAPWTTCSPRTRTASWPSWRASGESESTGKRQAFRSRFPKTRCSTRARWRYPWANSGCTALHPELMYYQDVRGAASASHVYGKKLVATESFTGGGYEAPYTLKRVGDYWFAQGVNRIVFHTSAHQPLDTKPGNTMVGRTSTATSRGRSKPSRS